LKSVKSRFAQLRVFSAAEWSAWLSGLGVLLYCPGSTADSDKQYGMGVSVCPPGGGSARLIDYIQSSSSGVRWQTVHWFRRALDIGSELWSETRSLAAT